VGGSVLFNPTGNDQVGEGGREELRRIAAETEEQASGSPRVVAEADVTGRASPRWRHPRRGVTGAEENQELSIRRARHTGEALHETMRGGSVPLGPPTIAGAGAPTTPADQDLPRQRRADIDVTVRRFREEPRPPGPVPPGPVPPGPVPPGPVPPQQDPHAPAPPPGQLPSLGWDTTVSGQVGAGAKGEASATLNANAGIAYTFGRRNAQTGEYTDPVWRQDFSAAVGKGLRIVLGLYKVLMGVAHGNPIAIVRDAAGLVGGVEDIIGVELTDPIVNFLIPMPEGA
jgi:hypothetical protein